MVRQGEVYAANNGGWEYKIIDDKGNKWDSYYEAFNGVQLLTNKEAEDALAEVIADKDLFSNGRWIK